jgi:hypothetical protein
MALRDTDCETMDAIEHDDDAHTGLMRLFSGAVARPPLFSAIEEQVIDLARRDTLASLEAPGFVERTVRLLFGLRAASRALADARLETLRRAIVVARHRRHMPDAISRELYEQGFFDAQVRAIEARALAA